MQMETSKDIIISGKAFFFVRRRTRRRNSFSYFESLKSGLNKRLKNFYRSIKGKILTQSKKFWAVGKVPRHTRAPGRTYPSFSFNRYTFTNLWACLVIDNFNADLACLVTVNTFLCCPCLDLKFAFPSSDLSQYNNSY